MNFIKKIFGNKEDNTPVRSNSDFWNWFQKNERTFHNVVKKRGDIEGVFFDKLSAKLEELREGYYYLTGMLDANTVELVLTADGKIKNLVFVEELVRAAPNIPGWKFTAHKAETDIDNTTINMDKFVFSDETLSFYSNDDRAYPDVIDITVVFRDFNEEDRETITNGVFIFLDNFLGEIRFATIIDEIRVIGKDESTKELVPIEKLKAFLVWREKEFVEKYEGARHNTDSDNYSILEAEIENGNKLIATVNTDLLKWDGRASHPWIMTMDFKCDPEHTNGGMPDEETYELLGRIEDELMQELKDSDGYLNVGRQTADGIRTVYFACKEFRRASLVAHSTVEKYKDTISMDYNIYLDKYWQSFDRFDVSAAI